MSKSITLLLNDNAYKLFYEAAKCEGRSIHNFIEYAALSYLANENYVRSDKINEIVIDRKFIQNIANSLDIFSKLKS
jgi:uncharacterized protein (DUF1778 family)